MGVWLRRLAYLAILGFPIAVIGYRAGMFEFPVSFKILTYTIYLAVTVFALGLLLAILQRKSQPSSAKAALVASILCLLPLLGLGSQLITAKNVPRIHNISTDTVDPPEFDRIAQLRANHHNPLEYEASELAARQAAAYPQVKTLYSKLDKVAAFDKALVVAEALGWEVVAHDPVRGIIEATETTLVWGFQDDVVIRVREAQGQVAIDLRSVSRIGQSDLGANAKRIAAFLQAYQRG